MTATQSDDDQSFTRRGVMRKATAVGVGSAATIGGAHRMGVSPVGSARAIAPVVALGYAGAIGLGYLMYKNAETATGGQKVYSGYTGLDALKTNVYADVLEAKSADERVMTSIENNLTSSENVAIAKGKAALVTKLNEGASESEANTAMTAAVNDYYSTIQKNILTHAIAQMEKFGSMAKSLKSHPNSGSSISMFEIYKTLNGASYEPLASVISDDGTQTISFINGDTKDYQYNSLSTGAAANDIKWKPLRGSESDDTPIFRFTDPNSTSDPPATSSYSFRRITNAFEACVTKRDEVNSQLVGLASDLYSNYEPGEIPTEDVLDPVTAATELGNNTGLSLQEASAGMMGIPTSAGFSLRLELSDGSGGTYEVDAEIYTNAQPDDGSGNPAGFAVGQTYDPDNFQEPIYVSYEYVDPETGERSTDFTQIVEPFTVLEATDSEGNEVEEVTPTSRTAQTADISSIEEELASIREEQQRLLEKQQQPSGGAGAGFFGSGGPSTGVIAAVVGGIGVLYALTQGGMN